MLRSTSTGTSGDTQKTLSFPKVDTPLYVRKYARGVWLQIKKKQNGINDDAVRQYTDLKQRILRAFEKDKDYARVMIGEQFGFIKVFDSKVPKTVTSTRYIQYLKINTNGSLKENTKLRQVTVKTGNFVMPITGMTSVNKLPSTYMIISPNSSLNLMVYNGTIHLFIPQLTIEMIKLWVKAKLIFVVYVKALRRSFRNTTHAVMFIYNPHHNSLYFLDPWGKKSDVGKNLNIHILRTAFKTAFGITVQDYYPTAAMCPRYKLQREGDRKQIVMCALWTMLLITKYLAYVKDNGADHDPTKMVQTFFNHRDEKKHPLHVMDKWFRELYPEDEEVEKKEIDPEVKKTKSHDSVKQITTSNPCDQKEVFQCKCVAKCKHGYQRNPTTFRCYKPLHLSKPSLNPPVIKQCPESVYRQCNLENVTGVCRRSCNEHQVRHPDTLRCRKIKQ
jgi:hypothetical protein